MKRFAFILSLFTPIIFATDSFATDCDIPDLTTLIGTSASASSAYINNGDTFKEDKASYGQSYYDISGANTWAVDYGNSGMLVGQGRCSSQYGSNGQYTNGIPDDNGDWSNTTTLSALTNETGQDGAIYCWCNVEGYKSSSNSSLQSLSSSWVFNGDFGVAWNCANNCARNCSYNMQSGDSVDLAFRAAVFNSVTCESETPATPARSPLRVAAATHNAGENALVSAAYARGAYNANVANINNAIEYVEDSSIATINSAKVSADNVSLSVNGFTPSGTVSVNSSNATVSGTFNVPTTVALMDEWGATTTTNATLGGIQQANITNGGISGLSATFTGTASGNLSGTGSFSNASVHVDGWKPVNPE